MMNVMKIEVKEEAVGAAVLIPQGIEGSNGIHANQKGKITKIVRHLGKTILVVRLEEQDLILVS